METFTSVELQRFFLKIHTPLSFLSQIVYKDKPYQTPYTAPLLYLYTLSLSLL